MGVAPSRQIIFDPGAKLAACSSEPYATETREAVPRRREPLGD